MILVYSQSFIIHNAITYLCKKTNITNVFCFNDRVQFLTAATLLNHGWIVLDTVITKADDISWIHGKLRMRDKEENIYYIIKPKRLEKFYSIYVNTLSSIHDLLDFIRITQVNNAACGSVSLAENLYREINATLCNAYKDLLMHEKKGASGRSLYILKHGHKVYLNRRYQLKRKLKLQSMQELNSLMVMLK